MTNKQIEQRIKNLEEAVSALAGKMYARDSVNESNITRVDGIAQTACQEASISDLWNDTQLYVVGNCVLYGDNMYRCLVDNYGTLPNDTTYWVQTNIVDELNYLNERKADKV